MDKSKELTYHGQKPEEDVMPKVRYEDIPEDRRKKWASHLATFDGEMWLDICLDLLKYIEADDMGIPYDKIQKMNIRNVKGLVDEDTIKDYLEAPEPDADPEAGLDKEFYGRIIYVRKMERLYHLIRLYKTRDWWE